MIMDTITLKNLLNDIKDDLTLFDVPNVAIMLPPHLHGAKVVLIAPYKTLKMINEAIALLEQGLTESFIGVGPEIKTTNHQQIITVDRHNP